MKGINCGCLKIIALQCRGFLKQIDDFGGPKTLDVRDGFGGLNSSCNISDINMFEELSELGT